MVRTARSVHEFVSEIYLLIETFTEIQLLKARFINFSNLVLRFLKSFTSSVGVGLSVLLLICFVEVMNHKNRATKSFSNSETFSIKSVDVSTVVKFHYE